MFTVEDNALIPIPGMPLLKEPNYTELIGEKIKEALAAADQAEEKENNLEDLDANAFIEDYNKRIEETLIKDYSKVIEKTLAELLVSLIGYFAVSGDTYYIEYNEKLLRWKPGAPEWVDTGLTHKGQFTLDMIDSDKNFDSVPSNLAVSGSTLYLGTLDGHLFQSFDEGNTWNDITANLPFPVAYFRAVTFAGVHRLCRNR